MHQIIGIKIYFLTTHLLHTYLYFYYFAAKPRQTTPLAKAKAPHSFEPV